MTKSVVIKQTYRIVPDAPPEEWRLVVRPDGQVFLEARGRDQLGNTRWMPAPEVPQLIIPMLGKAVQALAAYGSIGRESDAEISLYAHEGSTDVVSVVLPDHAPTRPPSPGPQAASDLDGEPEPTPYESPDTYNADNYGAGGF